jgi:hypothetical protein
MRLQDPVESARAVSVPREAERRGSMRSYERQKQQVRRQIGRVLPGRGKGGRPSESLTFGQAVALIRAAPSSGLYAYVVLSLLVGIRTEEARGAAMGSRRPEGRPGCRPAGTRVAVWRSVRAHGTPRRRSPGALWGCPGWRWKRSVSICSGRQPRAAGRRSVAGQRARLHYSARDAA